MLQVKCKAVFGVISIATLAILLSGCDQTGNRNQAGDGKNAVNLIQAKMVKVDIPSPVFCDEDECTEYDLKTVQTNLPWINDYFMKRIEKDVPNAFSPAQAKGATKARNLPTGESLISVRYFGQNNQLASFEIQTYVYEPGAAHGMSHTEYVTFDLQQQKRLAISDILKPGVEAKLLEKLYESNKDWLVEHNIKPDQLTLSDNYYYGVHGLVFVYPLYELAAYAEGMSELILPYDEAEVFVKPAYFPGLVKTPQS